MRLHRPTGSLALDLSIQDRDLAQGIHALPCKGKQIKATPIICIVPLHLWLWRHNMNAILPRTWMMNKDGIISLNHLSLLPLSICNEYTMSSKQNYKYSLFENSNGSCYKNSLNCVLTSLFSQWHCYQTKSSDLSDVLKGLVTVFTCITKQ